MFSFTATLDFVEVVLVCNSAKEFIALTEWFKARGYEVTWHNHP